MQNTELIASTTPRSVDFTVREDFISQLPEILSNIEELKRWAEEQTGTDRVLMLESEEDYAMAKERCAQINKVLDSLDSKRKQIKKIYIAPYDRFETNLKEVKTILECARNNLWRQVTDAENKAKKAKQYRLMCYYEDAAGQDIARYRPFAAIMDKTWLNKSKRFESICSEIDSLIDGFKKEIEAIQALSKDNQRFLMHEYSRGATLSDIIKLNHTLNEQKQSDKATHDAVPTSSMGTPAYDAEEAIAEESIEEVPENAERMTYSIVFRVEGTRAEMQALKTFLKNNGYKYERA